MKKYLAALATMAAIGLAPATALAGDAIICYSSVQIMPSGMTGTVSYPQVTNGTKFTCRTGVAYTLRQLAQRGWEVGQLVPVVYSVTYSGATSTQRVRQQLIVRKK